MATENKLPRGRMGSERIDLELRTAGQAKRSVVIDYDKDGETKTYQVDPYSYRGAGDKLKFFGYDRVAKSIKGFAFAGIIRVEQTEQGFKPQWPVELGLTYEERTLALEEQGLTTSDAQAVVDAEDQKAGKP